MTCISTISPRRPINASLPSLALILVPVGNKFIFHKMNMSLNSILRTPNPNHRRLFSPALQLVLRKLSSKCPDGNENAVGSEESLGSLRT